MIESNRWGTEAGIHFTQEQGALLLTLLDCIVLSIVTWRSQHGLEGKAKSSSTSSYSHKIQSCKSRASRAAPPSPSLGCLVGSLTSLPAGTAGVLPSAWASKKDLTPSTSPSSPMSRLGTPGLCAANSTFQQPWSLLCSEPAQLSPNLVTKG